MAYWPEYEANLTMYEPIVYYVEIIRKSFWGKYRNVLDNYPIRLDFDTPNRTVFWVYSITSFCTGRKTDLKKIYLFEKQIISIFVMMIDEKSS